MRRARRVSTQSLPRTATEYQRAQRREHQEAVRAVRRRWSRRRGDFDASWSMVGPAVAAIVLTAQERVAGRARDYVPAVLADTGQTRALSPVGRANVPAFVGVTGAGIPVHDALDVAPIRAKQRVAGGMPQYAALATTGAWLGRSVGTILSDTSRAVEATEMYARAVGGYVRVLAPPSCSRCVVLAGRWYRKNAGFERHPNCDCYHIPSSEGIAGDLTLDPMAYYESQDEAGRIKLAGSRANYQAIEDGADLSQIVNAYRRTDGMRFAQSPSIIREASGLAFSPVTRRSLSFRAAQTARQTSRFSGLRLMPESIYRTAQSRDDALRLLRINGWIL